MSLIVHIHRPFASHYLCRKVVSLEWKHQDEQRNLCIPRPYSSLDQKPTVKLIKFSVILSWLFVSDSAISFFKKGFTLWMFFAEKTSLLISSFQMKQSYNKVTLSSLVQKIYLPLSKQTFARDESWRQSYKMNLVSKKNKVCINSWPVHYFN